MVLASQCQRKLSPAPSFTNYSLFFYLYFFNLTPFPTCRNLYDLMSPTATLFSSSASTLSSSFGINHRNHHQHDFSSPSSANSLFTPSYHTPAASTAQPNNWYQQYQSGDQYQVSFIPATYRKNKSLLVQNVLLAWRQNVLP